MRRAGGERTALVQAALNGSRGRSEHPGVPVTARELARDAVAVRRAGAGAVHLHPRAVTGEDSLAWQDVGPAVAAVRAHAPGLPVGVTTGAWASPDPGDRLRLVAGWAAGGTTDRPDFASVNWHEDGADAVADALLAAGVGVEAGLYHLDALEAWTRWPRYRDGCVRILLELPDGIGPSTTATLAHALLDGVRTSCWPALRLAVEIGLDVRVGLEDTLSGPDGTRAPDNAALVAAALAITAALPPIGPDGGTHPVG